MSALAQLEWTAAPTVPAEILAMPSPEWAVALYASDMPVRYGYHPPERVIAWIVQGTERLGGDLAVWQRAQEFSRVLSIRDDAERSAAWTRLFPKARRQDRAWGLAYALSCDLKDAGVRRWFPTVLVDLGTDEMGQHWTSEVPARDVEMHERATGESLPLYRSGRSGAVSVLK